MYICCVSMCVCVCVCVSLIPRNNMNLFTPHLIFSFVAVVIIKPVLIVVVKYTICFYADCIQGDLGVG